MNSTPNKIPLSADYFELQLRFSEEMAAQKDTPFKEAVLLYTNFFRRFGLGHPDDSNASETWQSYIQGLNKLNLHPEKLEWTQEFYRRHSQRFLRDHRQRFGAFVLELRGTVVRAHFEPDDTDDVSPLHNSKLELRQEELGDLFAFVKTNHPEAESVMGVSWLYNSKRYQRLFPAEHVASARVRTGLKRFQGSSSWGQFLDYQGQVKSMLKDQFLDNLMHLDANKPWLVFPLATLVLESPIEVFYEHFRV